MKIIGHRGARGYEPENTLDSFQKAIALGVDMIELDVHTVKTGEVVVIHDSTVDRTTNGTGLVADYTLEALRALDAGDGQKIPLLTEVLDLIDRRIPVNIEIKGEGSATAVARIIQRYTRLHGWRYDLFLVSSFHNKELQAFARLSPQTPISSLVTRLSKTYWRREGRTIRPQSIGVGRATRRDVQDAHRHGVRLFVYTVNSKQEANRLRKLRVDGIFSDYPDRIVETVYPKNRERVMHRAPSRS